MLMAMMQMARWSIVHRVEKDTTWIQIAVGKTAILLPINKRLGQD